MILLSGEHSYGLHIGISARGIIFKGGEALQCSKVNAKVWSAQFCVTTSIYSQAKFIMAHCSEAEQNQTEKFTARLEQASRLTVMQHWTGWSSLYSINNTILPAPVQWASRAGSGENPGHRNFHCLYTQWARGKELFEKRPESYLLHRWHYNMKV